MSEFSEKSYYLSRAIEADPSEIAPRIYVFNGVLKVNADTGYFDMVYDSPIAFEAVSGRLVRRGDHLYVKKIKLLYGSR